MRESRELSRCCKQQYADARNNWWMRERRGRISNSMSKHVSENIIKEPQTFFFYGTNNFGLLLIINNFLKRNFQIFPVRYKTGLGEYILEFTKIPSSVPLFFKRESISKQASLQCQSGGLIFWIFVFSYITV